MNRAEKSFIDLLKPLLKSRGFKFFTRRMAFLKPTDFGFLEISFASFPMPEDGGYQVISTGLGVRHNRVDEVVNQLGHIWGEDNKKATTTIYRGLDLFPFDSARDERKTISFKSVEIDAGDMASSIDEMMRSDGEGFFTKYSVLENCAADLNNPIDTVTHPLLNSFPLRAYYGVACQCVVDDVAVPDLVKRYLGYIKSQDIIDNGVYDVAASQSDVEGVARRIDYIVQAAAK